MDRPRFGKLGNWCMVHPNHFPMVFRAIWPKSTIYVCIHANTYAMNFSFFFVVFLLRFYYYSRWWRSDHHYRWVCKSYYAKEGMRKIFIDINIWWNLVCGSRKEGWRNQFFWSFLAVFFRHCIGNNNVGQPQIHVGCSLYNVIGRFW